MSREEQREYDAHIENLRYQRSVIQTGIIEGEAKGRAEGKAEGRADEKEQVVVNALRMGMTVENMATLTDLTIEQVTDILKRNGLVT